MSDIQLIVPEATTNIIENPAVASLTGYTAVGGARALTSDEQWRGLQSLEVTPAAGVNDGAYYGVFSATDVLDYTFSLMVKGVLNIPYKAYFASAAGAQEGTATQFTGTGEWELITVSITATGTADRRVYVVKDNDASVGVFYIDALQVEQKAYNTTFVYGDAPEGTWVGDRNSSASTRKGADKRGGRVRDIVTDLGASDVGGILGLGTPPVNILTDSQFGRDGATIQRVVVQPRDVSVTVTVKDKASFNDYAKVLADIYDVFNYDTGLSREQPTTLIFSELDKSLEIDIDYLNGIDGELNYIDSVTQSKTIRMRANNPFWREQGESGIDVNAFRALNLRGPFARLDRSWDALGTPALTAALSGAKFGPDGNIYVFGASLNIDGIANADYIAKYDRAIGAWEDIGGGTGPDGPVTDIAFDSNGDLLAIGSFANAGGGAVNGWARWNNSVWAAGTGGVGFAGAVDGKKVMVTQAGIYIVAGLAVTHIDGVAMSGVAHYDGAAWNNMAGGITSFTTFDVVELANTDILAVGSFTIAGGDSGDYMQSWDGVAWSEFGGGADSFVTTAVVAQNGDVYVGGSNLLSELGSNTTPISVNAVGRFNGTIWDNMGGGATVAAGARGSVADLSADSNGIIYAIGTWLDIGGLGQADNMASFNPLDSTWSLLDIDISGIAAAPVSIQIDQNDVSASPNMAIVLSGVGTLAAEASGETTVTNTGTTDALPTFRVDRSGGTSSNLASITNSTSDVEVLLNYDISDGETITVDVEQGTIESSFAGLIPDAVVGGTPITDLKLKPGENNVALYLINTGAPTMTASMTWKNRHWSVIGAAT